MTTLAQKNRVTKKPLQRNLSKEKENVEVFCRIRPLDRRNEGEEGSIKKISETTIAMTNVLQNQKNSSAYKEYQYTFQHVFNEDTTQDAVFEHIALPLVDGVLHGKNGLLFAYGVTSSGKTFTMTGTPSDKGILPRCLDVIFNSISPLQAKKYVFKPDKMNRFDVQTEADAMLERHSIDIAPKMIGLKTSKESSIPDIASASAIATKISDLDMDCFYSVFISYVEIYNNHVFDLLEDLQYDPITGYKDAMPKQIKTDTDNKMYVSGAVEVEVSNSQDALKLLVKGQKRRKNAATSLNSESSRSHSIFNIRVVQGPSDPQGEHPLMDKEKLTISQLSLVDLAGSERTARTGNTGDRLKEAGSINQSLMVLRSCIEALRENQNSKANKMVPYRDSKLTTLFKSFFEGNGKVDMIVCVNPRPSDYEETMNVMKFAEMTQEVQIPKVQVEKPDVGLMQGRRMANIQIKEATRAGLEVPGDLIHVYKSVVYNLGPAFPNLTLHDAYDEQTLAYLLKFLKDRTNRRATLVTDLASKEEAFRARLIDMDKELIELRQTVSQLQQRLRIKEDEVTCYSRRFAEQERMNESLHGKVSIYEQERRELEREVGEKNWTIVQERMRNNMLTKDFNAIIKRNEFQYNQNIEQTKRKVEEEVASKLRTKQQKLDQLKSIIDNDSDTSRPRLNSFTRSRPYHQQLEAYATKTAEMPGRTFKVPGATPFRKRTKSPPSTKPKPMGLERTKRRSKSTDALWIQHKPMASNDNATILKPSLKTLKSVARLNERDFKDKDINKYLLTHQGYDSNGEFATKFVKGDVMTTAGGGTAVVFTDVEVVKKKSPGTTRKRRSSSSHDDPEDSWTDVETRCHVGIEGHAKRTKCSEI